MKSIINHAGIFVFIICFLLINSIFIWAFEYESLYIGLLWLFIPLLMIGTIYVLTERLRQLQEKSLKISSLIWMYFEYILMFAGLYALSSLLTYGQAISDHAYIAAELMDKSNFNSAKFIAAEVLLFIDAIYFSVSIATTVGFGDLHATHPVVKIFVVIQVLSCLAIAILGAGHHFNNGSKT